MKTVFCILLIAALVVPVVYAADPSDDSLILYFSFDELDGDTVIDHSQYGNNGTIAGAPELVAGKFGNALKLNGESDWVEVPHAEILTVDESVTVMAWINAERHKGPNDQRWQGIVAKSNNPRSYSFYTEFPSECLHLSVGGGSVCDKKIPLNEWVHVVAQVDGGSTHKYWVNGEAAGEFGGKNNPPGKADTADVLVGRTHEGNREFLGLIDEVRIWNRALDEDEVIDQMEKGYFELFAVDPRQKLATTWGLLKKSQ